MKNSPDAKRGSGCQFVFLEEFFDPPRDFLPVRFERKMPCIQQMRFHVPQVAWIGCGTFWREDESFLPQTIKVGG
jgi:hypothetical protein